MLNAVIRKTLILSALCIYLLLCASCAEQSDVSLPVLEDYDKQIIEAEKTNLKLGVVTGPYGDMFREVVEPLLSKKGYSVELVTYENYIDPNFALARGEIDLNIFQHYMYLNSFKFEYNLDLSAIAEVPTAAMGIYSYKHSSLEDIKEGDTIAVPNDNTNLSRALLVLSAVGMISVDPAVDATKITTRNITKNPKNLQIIPLEAHVLSKSLDYYDMAVINGNFAIDAGLNLSDALFNETLTNHAYTNVIAVRTDDLGMQFVMDLITVLRSNEYKDEIMKEGGNYSHFQYPCNFNANSN